MKPNFARQVIGVTRFPVITHVGMNNMECPSLPDNVMSSAVKSNNYGEIIGGMLCGNSTLMLTLL